MSYRVIDEPPPECYERYFVPAIGGPCADDLLKVADLRPGERVLDVACGTGVVTRRAAEIVGGGGRVAGLDVNPGMLAVARASAPPDATIDWYETTAEAMPLPDASYDVVLCQMGLQFMQDRAAALREMRRVLVPGGRAVVSAPGPLPAMFSVLDDALARHVGPECAGFVRAVFSLHDTEELRALFTSAGFDEVDVSAAPKQLDLPEPEAFLWQYIHSTPLANGVSGLDDTQREALERDVCAAWRDHVRDGRLPLSVDMTTATGSRGS